MKKTPIALSSALVLLAGLGCRSERADVVDTLPQVEEIALPTQDEASEIAASEINASNVDAAYDALLAELEAERH